MLPSVGDKTHCMQGVGISPLWTPQPRDERLRRNFMKDPLMRYIDASCRS